MSLRDGRLKKPLNRAFSEINSSIEIDKRLYREDIRGSIAYAKGLKKRGILDKDEEKSIIGGLKEIEREIETGEFHFKKEDEDIHMNIERRLFENIGEAAYKLHTGRSRNEQIVLDEQLYLIDVTKIIDGKLYKLLKTILEKAKKNLSIIIPSYTHLRQAQAISISHIFLAYYHALYRDRERFKDFKKRLNIMPLGSGACAGSSIGIDRGLLMKELEFETLSRNSIDAVSTRDFIIEFEFICSLIFITLSRISEDIIIFSTDEFGYYTIPDNLSTTSSLMPHKKNPDSLELIRGKSAQAIGSLVSLMTLMKGIPYTYNRDLQEDKQGLFAIIDNTLLVLDVIIEVFKSLMMNKEMIDKRLESSKGFLFATDIADYLVEKGIAFRAAHRIVGEIVSFAVEKKRDLSEIALSEYRSFSPSFNDDIYSLFDPVKSVNRHDVVGGTAFKRIEEEIKVIEEELKEN